MLAPAGLVVVVDKPFMGWFCRLAATAYDLTAMGELPVLRTDRSNLSVMVAAAAARRQQPEVREKSPNFYPDSAAKESVKARMSVENPEIPS